MTYPIIIAGNKHRQSLSELETRQARLLTDRQQLEESAAKERAELEAECQSAKDSATKAREELEGNIFVPPCPCCLVSRLRG